MSDYNFTMEQLQAAKTAKSPEELVAKAKEQGIDITLEQAAAFLNGQTSELADEELENVAGGGCGDPSEQEIKWAAQAKADGRPYKVTWRAARDTCPACGSLASVYAARKGAGRDYGTLNQSIDITLFYDCKCYAESCQKAFDKIRE